MLLLRKKIMKQLFIFLVIGTIFSSCEREELFTQSGTLYAYYETEGEMLDIESESESNFRPAANKNVAMYHRNRAQLVANCCWDDEPSLIETNRFITSGETDQNGNYTLSTDLSDSQEEDRFFIYPEGLIAGFEMEFQTRGDIYTYQSQRIEIEIWDDINDLESEVALYITNRRKGIFEKDAFIKDSKSLEMGIYSQSYLESSEEDGHIVYREDAYLFQNVNYEYEYVLNGNRRVTGQFYTGDDSDIRKLIIHI